MRKLHEIRSDVLGIADIAEAGDLQAAAKLDKELTIEAEEKIKQYYYLIQSSMADVAEADVAIATATAFKKAKTNLISWLQENVKETMLQLQMKKLDQPTARITMVEKDRFVRCADDKVPCRFVTPVEIIENKVDWKAIEAEVAAGKEIPGCKIEKGGTKYLLFPKIKTMTEE